VSYFDEEMCKEIKQKQIENINHMNEDPPLQVDNIKKTS